ncbi:NVEALA domain-containing protein [Bacteroides hominis]|uniref:NVEALA family protein n=3 Tax=Bacteroides TaxID=816 RepID=A0AAP9NGX4_BACFG|nr:MULTISPECIES: NVEALA domain-containing protein [Bacteroides]EFR54501.1 hypothetical protein BFAG_03199 [Bacteroides fragilis 3_1_12]MBM6512108.1 hypothetical protein [Bacteroides fragilis]MCX8464187.1 NVEALA domain-containing protein [Bacteroides fragilis]MCZ2662726.1 NVEALA domain-containing protein [Bacteroides fragilis]MDV6133134.1 NVEALA domain-containing protein [Bacteroides hominis (ex Liu et al. 2022)]
MGKKILTAMIVAVVAVVAGYNIYAAQKDITLSEIALANVEALASTESIQIGCDNYSVVIKCQRVCTSCYRIWTTSVGYGNSTGFKGTCVCGRSY